MSIKNLNARVNIVIDKSYLRGASREQVSHLASQHTLLMSIPLLYECIKEEPEIRAKLFRKFPSTKPPYILIPPIYELIQLENSNHLPSGRPSANASNKDYSVHEKLIDESYVLSENQISALENKRAEVNADTAIFLSLVEQEAVNFKSEFDNIEVAQREDKKATIEKNISADQDYITGIIKRVSQCNGSMIQKNITFDINWANFRWFQVAQLFALDLYFRYPSLDDIKKSEKAYEKLRHDVIDAQYLMLALLEGGFATKERKLINWWNLLSPNGILIS